MLYNALPAPRFVVECFSGVKEVFSYKRIYCFSLFCSSKRVRRRAPFSHVIFTIQFVCMLSFIHSNCEHYSWCLYKHLHVVSVLRWHYMYKQMKVIITFEFIWISLWYVSRAGIKICKYARKTIKNFNVIIFSFVSAWGRVTVMSTVNIAVVTLWADNNTSSANI